MSDTLKVDLDPRKVINACKEMSASIQKLSEDAEESLGRNAKKSVDDFTENAEKGANKVSKTMRDLGTRIRDDLKSAFDIGSVLAGAKFAQDLNSGVKQVFDMERAFDRLNTRIGLSGVALTNFKTQLGRAVASTGSQLQDILPGVESAAARGGIKDTNQLSSIGKALGQAKQITGEDTTNLSDSIIEIMKAQGLKMNSTNFQSTLDAVEGTRASGSFKSAGEAAGQIGAMAPYAQVLGLNTRQMGGLAAQASQGGMGAEAILQQILQSGSTIQGRAVMNSTLGQNVFGKNGQLDVNALSKIDPNRFQNQQIMGEASGLSGANGTDLRRFIMAMKEGGGMQQVVSGLNETGSQYETATHNLASMIARFKEASKSAGREIAGGLSELVYGIATGDSSRIKHGASEAGSKLWENKGTVAADVGLTAGVGLLAGGGARRLLGRFGGVGGAIGSALGGEAAKAAGIQQVYVVNMPDGGLGGAASGGLMAGAGSLATKYGGKALGAVGGLAGMGLGLAYGGAALVGGAAGAYIGTKGSDYLYDKFGGDDKIGSLNQNAKDTKAYNESHGTNLSPSEYARMIHQAIVSGMKEAQDSRPLFMTFPSSVKGREVPGG